MGEREKEKGTRPDARELVRELEDEGYKRPSLWRQALPWIFTALVLAWIFSRINFDDFLYYLLNADKKLLVLSLVGFNVVFAVGDLISYGLCYRWYAAPGIRVVEAMRARWGTFLFHALYTPLSTIANLAYLYRKKGAPVTWSLSANAFTSVNDLFIINAMVTAALIINHYFPAVPELSSRWFWVIAVPWLIALGYAVYWFTPIRNLKRLEPVTRNPVLRSCRFSRWYHYLLVQGGRFMIAVAGIVAHGFALHAFGIQVPFPMLFVIGPLMVGVAFMPVSGGGFGGPQVVAMILLPYAFQDEALVTAYSMTFSAFFTGGRAVFGAAFLPGFLKDIKKSVPRISEDPLTGEPVSGPLKI